MNDTTLDYLMKRMEDRRRDSRRSDSRGSYDRRDGRDRTDETDRRGYNHGNVDFEGSMDFRRDREDSRDMRMRDRRDGHYEPLHLTKRDIKHWGSMIENTDGSHGCHYDMSDIDKIVDKLGIRFRDFGEMEFCMAVNMMYADYGHLFKRYASSSEDVLVMCAEMAKAFLEDPDGPEPSEKLALYFHCIVDSD